MTIRFRNWTRFLTLIGVIALSSEGLLASEEPKKDEPPKSPTGAAQPATEKKEEIIEPKQTSIEGLKEVKTDSGLKYWDIKVGDGASPLPVDKIKVHYTGWLLDGSMFYSSATRGAPETFPLNQMIKGWIEGIGSMKVGGKRRLEIPPDLAYGDKGRPPKIPPNSTLIFEVELLEVVQVPKQTSIDGLKEIKSDTGLKYWDIKVGDGAQATPTSKVTVNYTGWLLNGSMFYSSSTHGTPQTFPLDQALKGWAEGVTSMKVGGKRRLEIPPDLAYGERNQPGIPPNSTLILEVELLKVE